MPVSAACPVLVVEDEDDARASLEEWLELEGFEVAAAANGREALEWMRAREGARCVVLLDLFMPEVDGWQVYRELQASGWLERVHVLVTTSAPHLAPAGSTVIPKPIDLEGLVDAVRRASAQ